jgi:hypothetical protein
MLNRLRLALAVRRRRRIFLRGMDEHHRRPLETFRARIQTRVEPRRP